MGWNWKEIKFSDWIINCVNYRNQNVKKGRNA